MTEAATMTANWLASMKDESTVRKYKAGIQGYQGNPMEEAANRADAYVAGVQKAVTSGKFQAKLRRTPKDRWVNNSVKKGAANLATGAALAESKRAEFDRAFAPVAQAAHDAAVAAKRNGVSARERMNANFDRMSEFKFM